MKKNNLDEKLKKTKYEVIIIMDAVFTIITTFASYLFPDDIKPTIKIIVCLIIVIILLSINLIVVIINFNKFYNDYEKQYDYFTNKNDKTYKNSKDIKKLKKEIKKVKDNDLEYEIVDEW